jgi:hypothetical protein
MNAKKLLAWLMVAVLGLVLAQAVQRQLNLVINGQASNAKAIVVNGQSYVPVSALQALGITTSLSGSTLNLSNQAAGGANQRASLEGCLNEWLFNGIWRARVTKVEAIEVFGLKGWGVTLEMRNGTNRTLEPGQTGVRDSSGLSLVFADGSTANINASALSREYEGELRYKQIPQGAAVIYQIKFDTAKAEAPTKLLLEIDPSRLQRDLGVSYSTPAPSLRFKLDCTK